MFLRAFHLKILYVVVGTVLSALGLSLMIASNLGVDTLSVALFGIMNYVPIKFGYLSLSFNILVLSMAFFFDRSQLESEVLLMESVWELVLIFLAPFF